MCMATMLIINRIIFLILGSVIGFGIREIIYVLNDK